MSNALNNYDAIFNHFVDLAISRFTWENLPKGLDSETLERMLIERGQVFAFNDKYKGLLILPCSGTNDINIYGHFTKYNVYGLNGNLQKTIESDKGVRIKNTPSCRENVTFLEVISNRIASTESTQDVNLFQHNIPRIILTDDNGKLTAKNIIKQLQEFKIAIFTKKGIHKQLSTTEILDNTPQMILSDLQDHKQNLINEVLTYLGINNSNADKKERLIVDEVNANNDYISCNIDLMLDMRERAVNEINEKFGTNIIVKRREIYGSIHVDNETIDRE